MNGLNRILVVFGVFLAIGICGSGPLCAYTPTGVFRGFLEWVQPSGDGMLVFGSDMIMTEADSSFGVGGVYEMRLNQRLGVEFGLILTKLDFHITQVNDMRLDQKFGEASVVPLMVGLDVHLLGEDARTDLYLGPIISYNVWDDFEAMDGSEGSLESGVGLGAVLGLDVPIGSKGIQFNGALRYLTMELDDGMDTIDVNPLFVEVGFGYRF